MNQSRPTLGSGDYLGLALASAAVLALQVVATRLFSFLIWYHFAFLVLSIAFLGFTAGGLWVSKLAEEKPADGRRWLSNLGFGAGISAACAFFSLKFLPLEPHFLSGVSSSLIFVVAVLVMLVPFVCLGAYICLALSLWSEQISSLYAINLGGSALGCSLVVLLLDTFGVPGAYFASCVLAIIAGACAFRPSAERRWTWALIGLLVVGFATATGFATKELSAWVYVKSAKAFPHLPRELISARESDSLSSVETYKMPGANATLWGVSPRYNRPPPDLIGFAIDGWALTAVYNRAEMDAPDSVIRYLPAALPYQLQPTHNALVIGAGGGLDVLTALHFGAQHVTGVEINPIILRAVKETYAEFAGGLYSDPKVEMHNAEGRHYLKRDHRKYDMIQLSGVDTFAASQAGAFALHENYLYTVEAMRAYLAALQPKGMLTFTRWLYIPPRQTIRLCAIADQAFRERGVEHPENHIAVYESDEFTVVLIRNDEFSKADIDKLQQHLAELQFRLIYAPHVRVNPFKDRWGDVNPFYALWDVGPQRFIEDYPLDIRPTTDDRPFFFEYQRWGRTLAVDKVFHTQNAQVVLAETFVVCGFMCLVLLWLARKRLGVSSLRLSGSAHLYFVALGLAYICVENVMVQRMTLFLGNPAYALTVILFGLLLASGAGSAFATRSAFFRERAVLVMAAAGALILIYAYVLTPLLDALLGLELPWRVLITLVLLAPLGFLMGMPFPLAMSRLSKANIRLVPWAWIVNGAASVMGSVVTVIIAMSSGFTVVFWVAAALYVMAAVTYRRIVADS